MVGGTLVRRASSGLLVRLSGHSGAGKSRLLAALSKRGFRYRRPVLYTSRYPRQGEVHEQDYFFANPEEISELPRERYFVGPVRELVQAVDMDALEEDLLSGDPVVIEIFYKLWPGLVAQMRQRLHFDTASVYLTVIDPGIARGAADMQGVSDTIRRTVSEILEHRGKDSPLAIEQRARSTVDEILTVARSPDDYDAIIMSAPEGPDGRDAWTKHEQPTGAALRALDTFVSIVNDSNRRRQPPPAGESDVEEVRMNLMYARTALVTPFAFTHGLFVQLLLSEFSLVREEKNGGVRMEVSFGEDTPAILSMQAKRDIRLLTPDFNARAQAYDHALQAFLLGREPGEFRFDDPSFPFRYASGGTLPILQLRDGKKTTDYYCLFYRDVFPVGWNIANGACDNQQELFDPHETIEREFREELLLVDLDRQMRYVFGSTTWGSALSFPAFSVARRLWNERFGDRVDEDSFEEIEIPIKWIVGPDSLVIKNAGRRSRKLDGIFINVNAGDFGIEFDKLAVIPVESGSALLDGELKNDRLENRVVGLFEVERMNERVWADGVHEFSPDILYFDGERYAAAERDKVIEAYRSQEGRVSTLESQSEYREAENEGKQLDLCPATRQIIRRYKNLRLTHPDGARTIDSHAFDVFISFHRRDADIASQVFKLLKAKGYRVFLSNENDSPNWYQTILTALESCRCLVAVARNVRNLREDWPSFEWGAFHIAMLNKRKEAGAGIVSVIGFDKRQLPPPFTGFHSVRFGNDIAGNADELLNFVGRIVKRVD